MASASGSGEQTLDWTIQSGEWAADDHERRRLARGIRPVSDLGLSNHFDTPMFRKSYSLSSPWPAVASLANTPYGESR